MDEHCSVGMHYYLFLYMYYVFNHLEIKLLLHSGIEYIYMYVLYAQAMIDQKVWRITIFLFFRNMQNPFCILKYDIIICTPIPINYNVLLPCNAILC